MNDQANTLTAPDLQLGKLLACHECDFLMREPALALGEKTLCLNCGYELYVHRQNIIERSFALVVAALLLYVPANFLPIMELSLFGQSSKVTVWMGVVALFDSGMQGVAAIVFLCGMGIPLLKLLSQLAVLLSAHWSVGRRYGLLLYRNYHHLRDWGMLEVYLISVLVSLVKLAEMASINIGLGLACFVSLLLVQLLLEVVMSPQHIWKALSGDGAHAGD